MDSVIPRARLGNPGELDKAELQAALLDPDTIFCNFYEDPTTEATSD